MLESKHYFYRSRILTSVTVKIETIDVSHDYVNMNMYDKHTSTTFSID